MRYISTFGGAREVCRRHDHVDDFSNGYIGTIVYDLACSPLRSEKTRHVLSELHTLGTPARTFAQAVISRFTAERGWKLKVH